MSTTSKTRSGVELDDLMVAMDVVDTLRHRDELVKRELSTDTRRDKLIKKLKDIYQAQGIDVTEDILLEGVLALEEDRFSYNPPKKTFKVKLARLYIKRHRFLKPLSVFGLFFLITGTIHFFSETLPNWRLNHSYPDKIESLYQANVKAAKGETAKTRAHQLYQGGMSAIAMEDAEGSKKYLAALALLKRQLAQAYRVEVVNEPGNPSGIWRVSDINPNSRNYYLIVQALDINDDRVAIELTSEESAQSKQVKQWGVRVSEQTFNRIASDKSDDGIIQSKVIGQKHAGYLNPEYSIDYLGGEIYDW